ncbi:hypothetical protein [Chthoniobacter flavus]|nr:hypothetical protein [Chthoniobacter flavus]
MKTISPSLEAVASMLGVTLAEALELREQRRLAEQQEREARQQCLAASIQAVRSRCRW